MTLNPVVFSGSCTCELEETEEVSEDRYEEKDEEDDEEISVSICKLEEISEEKNSEVADEDEGLPEFEVQEHKSTSGSNNKIIFFIKNFAFLC